MVGGEAVRVEIWLVPASPIDDALLSTDERARAERFRHPTDRATYVAAHTALRVLAGARLGCGPTAVRFGCEACPLCGGPHGRPTLADGDGDGLHISLSRTQGGAAVAVAPAVVGVDLESVTRPVGLDDLEVALHPRELPVLDRHEALRRWVRKEAYLKGLGTGLGLDPATVDLSRDPAGWQVLDVPAGPASLCAVAVRSPAPVAVDVTTVAPGDLAFARPS
jgi:4'-phosphopantetheinyl transferase